MTNRTALSDRVIAFIAPRGTFDYWSKVLLVMLLIGLMNFLRDTIEYGDQRDTLLANTIQAAFAVLPVGLVADWPSQTHARQSDFACDDRYADGVTQSAGVL